MGVGFGYGLAHAMSKAGPAYNLGIEKQEAEDLKQRQMNVNEASEARALKLANEYIDTSQYEKKAKTGGMVGYNVGQETNAPLVGQKPSASGRIDDSTLAQAPAQPGATPEAQPPTEDMVGQARRSMFPGGTEDDLTLPPEDQDIQRGKSDKGVTVASGGQRPGLPPKGGPLRKPSVGGGYGVAAKTQPEVGLTAKEAEGVRQGKTQVAPDEVVNLTRNAVAYEDEARGVEERLAQAIKTVETQYAGDPTMLAYTKAAIYAQVRPHISELKTSAARAHQEAELAGFTHEAGNFAQSLLSHAEGGGVIDDKWIEANKDVATKLGVDPGMLIGLHKNKIGAIVNKEGYVYPRQSILRMANGALPWLERIKAASEIDKMFEVQSNLRRKMYQAGLNDPQRQLQFIMANIKANDAEYQNSEHTYRATLDWLSRDSNDKQPVKVKVIQDDGSVKVVDYKPASMWNIVNQPGGLAKLETSPDPATRAYYTEHILPILTDRATRRTLGEVLSGWKGNIKVKNDIDLDQEEDIERIKAKAKEEGKLSAQDEADVRRRESLKTNPAKTGGR